jgi:N-acetylmuramoyl-L-alanine amidase
MAFRTVIARSPNCDDRPDGVAIDMLLLHYTGMKSAENAISRLCDAAAKVSAHYTIDRAGRVYAHVAEEKRAWHAGASWWAGKDKANDRTIGIELVNPGHEFGYVPFSDDQIDALIELANGILSRHPIPPRHVLGHSDVAPARKTDPGELFPWKLLAENGIGLWPKLSSPVYGGGGALAPEGASAALARFGYGVPPDVNVPLAMVISAFQRHFRPAKINGEWDAECEALLNKLNEGLA